jgi:hypothetical protein
MIKELINSFRRGYRDALANKPKVAVAKWCIQQFIVCPHCRHEFDIIQANLDRRTNQGTIKISQKQVTRYDKDKFDYNEINVEIPTPPYFGALCEDTENLDEHIDCIKCNGPITVHEAVWQFGR